MVAQPRQRMSEQEYLAFERASDTKHEYYRGEVFAMAGASLEHTQIVSNTLIAVGRQLRPPCRIVSNDLRTKISETGLYTYPDIIIVCGRPQLAEGQFDTLVNPTILSEVLSPSTEAFDRGKKFRHYRTLDSLQEYLLIAQDAPLVEHFVRQEDGTWRFAAASGLDASLHLPTIDCTLALAEVYSLVEWDESTPEDMSPIIT
jgi:Uma2 family endonuclease